jgi:hypothetical protein
MVINTYVISLAFIVCKLKVIPLEPNDMLNLLNLAEEKGFFVIKLERVEVILSLVSGHSFKLCNDNHFIRFQYGLQIIREGV